MKKIYLVILLSAFASFTFAQSRTGSLIPGTKMNSATPQIKINSSKANGDTLMHFDGFYFYVNPTDEATFDVVNEDLDNKIPAQTGWDSDWMFWYSLDPADFLHDDFDSAFYMSSSSWFNPAGQCDDWFSFGPITMTAGATVAWAVKCNPAYRDGYKVYISSTGLSNYTDFTSPAIYTRTDMYPSNTQATDTVWTYVTATVPSSYSGGQIYVGFNHDANDMDVLWLDEISVIEGPLGITEGTFNGGIKLNQNQPNPATRTTSIEYVIENNSDVTLEIYDITGRLVTTYDQGQQTAGIHNIIIDTDQLTKGTYFYTLIANGYRSTKKMVITE